MMYNKIAIHGVPRSGTSWVGSLFDSSRNVVYRHQPLFSYAFKSFLSENSSRKEINEFFKKISTSNDDFITQKKEKEKGSIPSFKKDNITHIVYKEARYHHILKNLLEKNKEIKVVGIIRNPKSVINSWINAPKEFDSENWNVSAEWRKAPKKNKNSIEEFYGYEKWKEIANLFIELKQKYPNRFYILNYKMLLYNTEDEVKKMFRFCNLNIDNQVLEFITNGQKKDMSHNAYSVFRLNQKDDKWIENLPTCIIDEIDDDLKETSLEPYIY
ncbi:sulfotransferase domain-containing protein [uncultured Algibacter sp.]|uniref:sulfotransferase domain-containing protein n=1 Tax=uncultured Algibacter sp. TaxID=298659 RepID=UPI0026248D79|nr:sulfotransferase domain-containing protein [uncultured Algibacter sp.]